jgi:hypothetical protein
MIQNNIFKPSVKHFSYKQFAQLMVILLLVVGLLKLSPYFIYAVGVLLLTTLLANRTEYTFGSMMLLFVLSVVNTVLVDKDFSFYLVTRGSLFILAVALATKSGGMKNAWFLSPFYVLIAYIVYMMLISLGGWAPLISTLKAVLFLVFIVAFIQIVSAVNLKQVNIDFMRSLMLVIAAFYILGSLAVIPFPAIGQSMVFRIAESYNIDITTIDRETKSLFNGMTWHSQTLGPLLAVLNAFLLSDYLFSFKKRNYLYVTLLASIPILVYMTSSRTAFFAYIISILASLFLFQNERNIGFGKKQKVFLAFFCLVIIVTSFLIVSPHSQLRIEAFLLKSNDITAADRSDSLFDDVVSSRIGLAEQGMDNFKKRPLTGNGFQVSENMQNYDRTDMTMLLSAPVEKGVLAIMVLEEGGVIGAFIFLGFLITLYVKYMKLKLNCFLATFTVFVALNTGEATFFSTSGAGGILWSICFCSLIIDVDRNRKMLAQKQMNQLSQYVVR